MNRFSHKLARRTAAAIFGATLFLGAGCSTSKPSLPEIGARHTPQNVFHAVTKLPPDLRRVMLMPPTSSPEDAATTGALPALSRIFEEELRKTARFDVVNIPVTELKRGFGRESFSASDTLPPDLLSRLKTAHTGDAVVFMKVTSYRPYPPVAVGVDIRLVMVNTGQTLWSVDEVFDAAQPAVARSARDYFKEHHTGVAELLDPQADMRSPLKFSRYAMQAALSTVPAR